MNQTESYLRERFKSSNWPYHSLNSTKYEVGETFDTDIKELREKEMIKPTAGINGWLIEILDFETKWNTN